MRKFRTSKKFWLSLLSLIGIGLFIYFVFFVRPPEEISEKEITEELPEEIRKDKISPLTAIVSPKNKSWWNNDFEVTIYDSDLGSGLKECRYLIHDLGTDRVGGEFRRCDPVKINIPVGEGKTCSSSFAKENISLGKCKVSTLAIDKADNQSDWKSRVFNIDLIKPKVGGIISEQNLELNKSYPFETTISDNSKITGCWFYVNGEIADTPTKITPVPCENENQCNVSGNYTFAKEGEYLIRFGCSDIAGNLGFGNQVIVKVTTNHPPKISFCKVNPTQGTIETEFQFDISANDPDGDQIFYLWDFGDGENSSEEKLIHFYKKGGTFEPKVIVSDGRGGESQCQTAWVTVLK